MSEHSALSAASGLASTIPGGPWLLAEATGMKPVYNSSENIIGAGCGAISGYFIHLPSVEGINGTYWTGLAATWLLEFINATSIGALYLLVQNGVASEFGEISGRCEPGLGNVLSGPLIDSTWAAWAAERTTNGTKYMSDVLRANATYTLFDGGGFNVPTWAIEFLGCYGETQVAFSADVSATTGTVTAAEFWYPGANATCGT